MPSRDLFEPPSPRHLLEQTEPRQVASNRRHLLALLVARERILRMRENSSQAVTAWLIGETLACQRVAAGQ
jgi:hypothetical protein